MKTPTQDNLSTLLMADAKRVIMDKYFQHMGILMEEESYNILVAPQNVDVVLDLIGFPSYEECGFCRDDLFKEFYEAIDIPLQKGGDENSAIQKILNTIRDDEDQWLKKGIETYIGSMQKKVETLKKKEKNEPVV